MQILSEWAYLDLDEAEMKQYLFSDEVFWPLSPGKQRFTIGNGLLAVRRLSRTLQENELERFSEALKHIESLRGKWLANWRVKAGNEFSARLNLWQDALRELQNSQQCSQMLYQQEVRQRVLLTLLETELGEEKMPLLANLHQMDTLLSSLTVRGEFIWKAEFQASFPENTFWFLYRKID